MFISTSAQIYGLFVCLFVCPAVMMLGYQSACSGDIFLDQPAGISWWMGMFYPARWENKH